MRRFLNLCVLVIGLGAFAGAQALDEAALRQLYDSNSWFDLRDAIEGVKAAALYHGAVAVAFNRVGDGEKYLVQAMREAANTEAANEARGLLALLYVRLGRSSDAGRLMDDLLKAAPQRSDVRKLQVMFGAFADRPNQSVRSNRRVTFPCEVRDNGVRLPVAVNGTSVNWLLDTAANITLLSESEAKMLGLSVPGAHGQVGDLAGGTTTARSVVAARVTIGGAELRNVPMLVLPDGQPPWGDWKPGERGAIGLPVAAALLTIRWTKSGMCSTGPSVSNRRTGRGNLAFDYLFPLVRAEFEGRTLEFVLDTGNQAGTQLWERFGRDFAALVKERGRRGMQRITQVGGVSEREIIVIPELVLRVGGLDGRLQPANLFSRPVGDDRRHGNLGMDVLSQATGVAIDFQSMSLTLEYVQPREHR